MLLFLSHHLAAQAPAMCMYGKSISHTMRGKILHHFMFVLALSNVIYYDNVWHTYTSINSLSPIHPCIPYYLYNQRRGTSFSFKSIAGQRTVQRTTIEQLCGETPDLICCAQPVTF